MKDFLYCFDSNYNQQALTSIFSLLDNTSSKINLYIIHNDPTTFKIQKIINHKNLDIFKIYKFKNDKKIDFPNLNNSHVSEATYYDCL